MPNTSREAAKAPERLVSSVLSAWEGDGAEAISARMLASAAGLPVSAIHYHFGGLGQLLDAAQADAIDSARAWCEAQQEAIGKAAISPDMLGPLLACLIDDWCEMQRGLAFAWREGQLMALRDPDRCWAARQWDQMWQGFFDQLCAGMGLSEFATLTAWFFDGASGLHILRWRRPLDRSALEELCNGWAAWLGGKLAPQGGWFDTGQRDAQMLAATPEPSDSVAETIANAAAQVVAESGVTALTHRAVAAAANVTLGTVSYKFRTSADLMRAAFDGIYRRMQSRSPVRLGENAAMTMEEVIALAEQGAPSRADMLGSGELCIVTARNPAFQPFAAQLRYLRGRGSARILERALGRDQAISPIDGAILSAVLGGRGQACNSTGRASPGDLAPLIQRLASGRT